MGLQIESRDELLASLRGTTLKIPDVQQLLKEWPQYINLELNRLRGDVDEKLQEWVAPVVYLLSAGTDLVFLAFSLKAKGSTKREQQTTSAHADTPDQIKTFFDEFKFFVEMTDVEQRVLMSQKLPSVDEYHQRRMGSSAVRMCLAITE
ncbi:MAG: hypothetical protein Q9202_003282 [Teloschistes flavicans]